MNKVVVITGSRQGIGRYLTEYYLEKGYVLIGCDLFETDLKHENYEHYCLDVADESAVKKMISEIKERMPVKASLKRSDRLSTKGFCVCKP